MKFDSLVLKDPLSILDKINQIPPDIIGRLITIIQALGIAFIVYIVVLITRLILSMRRKQEIEEIHKHLDKIDKKLDLLLNNKKFNPQKNSHK
jgi:hypothetical protein